ncbi:MAG: hypothetical protein KIT31_37545, partial [Deltaproteobacteria bacterium]|nr:hypothetical protein [Deltaproteobacteria bacterium]
PVTIAPAAPAGLQASIEAELDRAIAAHKARGAVAVILDARTGAPVLVAARGNGDVKVARAPGSTVKPFTVAAALEASVVDTRTRLDCRGARAYGDRSITDGKARGVLDLGGILAVSSNVCTAQIAELVGDRLAGALRRYHLPAPAQIDTRSFEGAAMASGEGLFVTPLDVASAYTAFANGGVFHGRDGASERVMTQDAAKTVLALLDRPISDPDGTAHAARLEGVRVAGKTGTVQSASGGYYGSFVGIVPADAPRFIVLAAVDGGVDSMGGKVAAPLFAKIAAQTLAR